MQYSVKTLLHVQSSRKMGPIIKTKKQAKERDLEITKILELGFNFLNGNYKHIYLKENMGIIRKQVGTLKREI